MFGSFSGLLLGFSPDHRVKDFYSVRPLAGCLAREEGEGPVVIIRIRSWSINKINKGGIYFFFRSTTTR